VVAVLLAAAVLPVAEEEEAAAEVHHQLLRAEGVDPVAAAVPPVAVGDPVAAEAAEAVRLRHRPIQAVQEELGAREVRQTHQWRHRRALASLQSPFAPL